MDDRRALWPQYNLLQGLTYAEPRPSGVRNAVHGRPDMLKCALQMEGLARLDTSLLGQRLGASCSTCSNTSILPATDYGDAYSNIQTVVG